MRRRTPALALLVGLLLACTGLEEWVEQAEQGEHITERDDGFDLELPNGNGVHVYWGDDISKPRQIPLPAPPEGALISWAEADLPMLQPAYLAMYGTLTPKQEVVRFYRDAMEAQGIDVERRKDPDSGSVALAGKGADAYVLAVVHPDGAVLLAAGPEQAVDLAVLHARKHQDRNPRRARARLKAR